MTIQDLTQLAGKQGKVVIIDTDGKVVGIFLSEAQYHQLVGANINDTTMVQPVSIPAEQVNREILNAQLDEISQIAVSNNLETFQPQSMVAPERIGNILSQRAQELFVAKENNLEPENKFDLREEVMDPSYIAKSQRPVANIDTEEEIRPNFDDI
jgi:hypothetical protein